VKLVCGWCGSELDFDKVEIVYDASFDWNRWQTDVYLHKIKAPCEMCNEVREKDL
jgi:hypothetical protein